MDIAQRSRRRRTPKPFVADASRAARGVVVAHSSEPENTHDHESVTRRHIAKKLAALKGYEFGGEYDPGARYAGRVYFMPSHTIVGVETARALGISGEHDLFGGVVPHGFVATKSITHPLVDGAAKAPRGWSLAFTHAVREAVLPGYSAFSAADARRAGRALLERGSVRVKPALAIGGRGQSVVDSADTLDEAVAGIEPNELAVCGVVLEENLADVVTFSVGRVRVDDLVASYFGVQKLTVAHDGAEVYGGSDLTVVQGDFDALVALGLPRDAMLAVKHARNYDAAASACFPGFMASRRNYDVALGTRERGGERHCGVLEQSWRVGGASGAEVAALEAFRAAPSTRAIRASCFEVYGAGAAPPGSTVYFDGVDDKVGRILKYTVVEPYVDA